LSTRGHRYELKVVHQLYILCSSMNVLSTRETVYQPTLLISLVARVLVYKTSQFIQPFTTILIFTQSAYVFLCFYTSFIPRSGYFGA